MRKNLHRLINDFQSYVHAALKVMYRSGIEMPSSRSQWIESDIPLTGELEDGMKYYKHGAGCLVELGSGRVDFDFGENGEVGGFNAWWLTCFAGKNLKDYGFENLEDVTDQIDKALADGELVFPHRDLYYIANVPYTYAIDTDSRNLGDMLPARNHDRVLTLQIHYFETAELMYRNYNNLKLKRDKNKRLNRQDAFDMRIYLSTWLGFLGVTSEGFRELNMRVLLNDERPESFKELLLLSGSIGKLMKEHKDSLRIFRNNVFHLRKNTDFAYHFFDEGACRLHWARELHESFRDFFSQYRVSCEVHYVLNGRKGESELINKKKKRSKNAL